MSRTSIAPAGVLLLSTFLSSVLLGCPQGVAGAPSRPDDAAADAEASDAELSDAEAPGAEAPDVTIGERPPESSSGALCGVNDRDQCGAFGICANKLGCVECVGDADCPASAARCLQGTCVGCRPSAGQTDCPGGGLACWTSDYECHAACTAGGSCPAGTTCDEVTGGCVGCTTDAQCAGGPSGVCSRVLRRCVACASDRACPAQRPRCRVLTGACVACTSNDDCGLAAPICDPTTFTCRVGCSSDAQCPGSRCDLDTATCVVATDAGTDASTEAGP